MTHFDPARHHRRSIRLKNYDYSQPGAYFITIVTHQREKLFGDVINGEMRLNDAGKIARQCWWDIPRHFPHVKLDEFVIMPNHIHGILIFVAAGTKNDIAGAKNFSPLQSQSSNMPKSPSRTVGSVVRGFKIGVTKWFRQNTDVYNVWQRNYYEHIVRNKTELRRIRQYILQNPKRWAKDNENMPSSPG